MMPQLYEMIESAIANGVPPQYVADSLIKHGWPPALVNEALNAWLLVHGRSIRKTDFKAWLAKYRAKATPAMFAIVLVGILSSSVILLRPWPTKIMVDSVFGDVTAPGPLAPYTHTATLILLTSLMTVVIFIVGAIIGTFRDYLVLRLGFWLNRGIKVESFRHILHLPLYHQQRLAKGDYIYRQNILTNSLSDLVLDTTGSIIQSAVMIVGIICIMLLFDAKLTLISIVVIPFLFLLIKAFGPPLSKISQQLTQTASRTSSTITESVDNAETVQSFNLEEKQINKANQLWQQTYDLSNRGLLWGHLYRFSNSLLIIIATSTVMFFGGSLALKRQITLGELLIFMTYMGYLLGPVETLAAQIASRNQKLVDVSRVYEVLTDHEGIEDLRPDKHLPIGQGKIVFHNVSYVYNNSLVLKDVNLTIEPKQKVGIIGPSGSGKSTLLKLLPLFIEPSGGQIMIDNIDIQTVSLKELRQNVTWISQSPQLFNTSVLENLLDGNIYRQVGSNEVEQAITGADVKEFTDRFPLGLSTLTGEGGNSLSGGQRQRIAIARGLIKNAPIMCMDEPTAALDSKSEEAVRTAIASLITDKTVLLVTHRKALLSLMDVVYVLEDGQLKNVKEYGGLDQYLIKINDTEGQTDTRRQKAAAVHENNKELQTRDRQRLAELELENAKLQQKLSMPTAAPQPDSSGTIYIDH